MQFLVSLCNYAIANSCKLKSSFWPTDQRLLSLVLLYLSEQCRSHRRQLANTVRKLGHQRPNLRCSSLALLGSAWPSLLRCKNSKSNLHWGWYLGLRHSVCPGHWYNLSFFFKKWETKVWANRPSHSSTSTRCNTKSEITTKGHKPEL